MVSDETAPRPNEVFAWQVARFRKAREMTTADLAEKVRELSGERMHATTITKIEQGDRKVTVNELFWFAAALNVPPALLLLPLGSAPRVEVTTQSVIHPHLALDWLAGDESLASTDRMSIGGRDYYEALEPIRLHRALRRAQNDAGLAYSNLQRAQYVGDDKALAEARATLADVFEGLARVLASMRRAREEPPRMPDEYLEEAKRMGIDLEGDDDGEH